MYHILYKTTNKLTKKYYIGIHSSKVLDDEYLGSGLVLGHSIKKYGRENHVREILELLKTREDLLKRETEVVIEELLKDPLCLNLALGGCGEWKYVNLNKIRSSGFKGKRHSIKNKQHFQKCAQERFNDPVKVEEFKKSFIGKKRQSTAAEMILISPEGKEIKLDVGFEYFCKQNNLPFTIMRAWVNRGKIKFKKKLKKAISKNAENWEIKSAAKYYST